jgi:hypothetical protein
MLSDAALAEQKKRIGIQSINILFFFEDTESQIKGKELHLLMHGMELAPS